MTALEIVASLRARGVTVVADGDILRCRPKSALTEADLELLRSRKAEILICLRPAAIHTHPMACFTCRSRRFWKSLHGAVVCAVCHPPAAGSLVVAWLDASERAASVKPHSHRSSPTAPRHDVLPNSAPQDIEKVEKLLSKFGATIVASGPDTSTDGAA